MKKIELNADIWDQLHTLKKKLQYKRWSAVVQWLLDHQSLQGENTQKPDREKLAEKEVLEEVYNHIQQLHPFQKLKGKPVSSKSSTSLVSNHEKGDDSCMTEWLCCPVCWNVVPLKVELDPDGNPLNRPENGVKFKNVDGVLQRRFIGPDDSYLPVQARIGDRIVIEDSMAISTLRLLNRKLFDHILSRLEHAYFLFGGRKV